MSTKRNHSSQIKQKLSNESLCSIHKYQKGDKTQDWVTKNILKFCFTRKQLTINRCKSHSKFYFIGKFQNCRNSTAASDTIPNTVYIFKCFKVAIWPLLRWQDIQHRREFCKTQPSHTKVAYRREPFLLLICLPGSSYSRVLLNTWIETANIHTTQSQEL